MVNETIYALASGPGVAGIAVVRLSGDAVQEILMRLTRTALPAPRKATLRDLRDPDSNILLDRALLLYFPAPHSFTGDHVAELHLHGGRAVVDSVLAVLARQPECRLAEAGEFSRRAVEQGKMDLTEAEGLNDLIHAVTASQHELALRQMDGQLRILYQRWRDQLMQDLAHLEADIDFSDEDLPDGVASAVRPRVEALRAEISDHLADHRRGEMLRDGLKLTILGAPNSGKSTLTNWLSGRDVAIVTDVAGTTRDVVEVTLDLGGYPVVLMDTAGLRDTSDIVEQEGVRRAVAKAADADLRLLLVRADQQDAGYAAVSNWLDDRDSLLFLSQVDRVDIVDAGDAIPLSVHDEDSLQVLLARVTEAVADRLALREAPVLTRARHREALSDVRDHLSRFLNEGVDPVLMAEDIRLAARGIGRITGGVGVEDMLDRVFADFCIGK